MINLEKEIRQQPDVLKKFIEINEKTADEIVLKAKEKNICGIYFAARGTSDHACIYGQYLLGIMCGIPCVLGTPSVVTKYNSVINLEKYLVIGVSQSGMAEDVNEIIKMAKSQGAITVAVTNELGSLLAENAEYHIYCGAGKELSIAATKTFTSQMMAMALLAAKFSENNSFLDELKNVYKYVDETFNNFDKEIDSLAEELKNIDGAVILGRGVEYPIALEGALKMLETNKIKMKGYPISDFHHGPIAQIKENDTVFVLTTDKETEKDVEDILLKLDNVKANIILVTDNDKVFKGRKRIKVATPENKLLAPFVSVLTFQMLACKMTIKKGIDPDKAGVINKITITK